MNDERLATARLIFDAVANLSPTERARVLSARCRDDAELRRFVEQLLANHDSGLGSFLNRATVGEATRAAGRDASPDAEARIGRRISHYEVLEKLGAGGMGEVYLARDIALDRMVALKVLPASFKPSVRDRLLREAWASAKVQHPAIATFFEAGQDDGIDFIAMEHVRGRTLRDHLRDGPLPRDRALEVVANVLEALVHAHFSGILHRDIKPDNIMITEDGAAKLLDFGLARGALMEAESDPLVERKRAAPAAAAATEDATRPVSLDHLRGLATLTQAGVVMGTPGYMPPEQIRGEPVDARADVFAMGAVAYEIISGRPPFPGSVRERIQAILDREPALLEGPGIGSDLREAVSRALAKDPGDRFPSAADFLREVRALQGERHRPSRSVTLALVDLRNLSGDPDRDWIGTGFADALASSLTGLAGLRLVPREQISKIVAGVEGGDPPNDVELGLQLGCSTVLSGSYAVEGSALVTTFRITDVATGRIVADEELRAGPDQLRELQRRSATAVTLALGLETAGAGGDLPRLEAFECHTRARRLIMSTDRGAFEHARTLLKRAVALEPTYARAWASLAHQHAWAYHSMGDPDVLEVAATYARRAIDADPKLCEAHLWRGYVLMAQRRAGDAIRAFQEATKLDPTNALAAYMLDALRSLGRPRTEAFEMVDALGGPADLPDPHRWLRESAVRHMQQVLLVNPRFCWAWLGLGWSHLECGHREEARVCLTKAIELEPMAVPPTAGVEGYLGECLRRDGDLAEARARFLSALESLERTDHMYRDTWRGVFLCGLGRTALAQDDKPAARTAFQQAVLHLKGRPRARCGGHVLVQGLAGLTRSGGGAEPFEEGLRLFEERSGYEFGLLWGCSEDLDLLELARAADGLGRRRQADDLLEQAREAGSVEALTERLDV